MKRALFLVFSMMTITRLGAEIRSPSPFILLPTTSNWTAGQRFTWIEVSSCTGCGSGSGGNSATLQSPATGPYDLAGVGAVMNSTGVYLSSGSISIGSNPATALLEVNSPNGNFIPVIITTPGGARIVEVANSSITVSTATFLIQSTVSYGVPLSVGIGGRTGDRPGASAPIIAQFGGFDGSLTPKIIVRNHSTNVEMQVGAGNNLGILGSFSNTPLQVRVGDAHNWTFDTGGHFTIRTTISGGKLLVGTNGTAGSKFQVFDGSATINGAGSGLVVGSTQLVVNPGGGVSIGTTRPSSALDVTEGSVTVRAGTIGNSGGISASSYTVRGIPVVYSTWSVRQYDGYIVVATTGSIAPNTTITITATELGLSALGVQTCGELEGVNTAGVSVRVKSLTGLPASFQIYNADIVNIKNFTCIGAGFP